MKKYMALFLLISFALANMIYFLDEGLYSFSYWEKPGEVLILCILTVLITILPGFLFFQFKENRFLAAFTGYLPVLLLVVWQTGIWINS